MHEQWSLVTGQYFESDIKGAALVTPHTNFHPRTSSHSRVVHSESHLVVHGTRKLNPEAFWVCFNLIIFDLTPANLCERRISTWSWFKFFSAILLNLYQRNQLAPLSLVQSASKTLFTDKSDRLSDLVSSKRTDELQIYHRNRTWPMWNLGQWS